MDSDEILEAVGCGSLHEAFLEINEVTDIIARLKDIYNDQVMVEGSYERFLYIMDQYQEQPHLIDPHIELLLGSLLAIARDPASPPPLMHQAFKYLYLITKLRGPKTVVRLLPHEVADMEPVLLLLSAQNPNDFEVWETRYFLLLWLSIVCMIPFDMSRLDSNVRSKTGEVKKPVMDRILDIGKQYLMVNDKCRDAAAYLVSRFLTRPDVKKQKLPEFLDTLLTEMLKADRTRMTGMTTVCSLLQVLTLLYKHGKREDLLEFAPMILRKIVDADFSSSNNSLMRKYVTKVIQRLGLIFLKNRVASWRYQRGSRSLSENLKVNKSSIAQTQDKIDAEEDEDYEIPDEIEEVIEQLLSSLKDKDTVVRWSSAKGIGRITGRLPKELADEVVGSVLELFTLQEGDGAWHGGCLALAELGRRGLLVPSRLPDVVPVVLKSLHYDEKRGNFSVGAHVRDAACYVCWAFARAYDPKEITPYVNKISSALVITSIFDREVNVRRAASAAFQENVGRQGTFPHGIDILTTADYHAVGNRTHCYLEVSVYVAQFPEYTQNMIDHLIDAKINHWDSAMREVSAKALHNLTAKAPEYMSKNVLGKLVPFCTGIDLYVRHGAILAAAEITNALANLAHDKSLKITDYVSGECMDGLKKIVKTLNEGKLFRGLGGELMRKAVCCLIEKLSLSKFPFHDDPVIEMWQEIINDCLHHVEPEVQICAVNAIPAFFSEYYTDSNGNVKSEQQVKIVDKYLKELKHNLETSRMGYSLAIGAFPKCFIKGKLKEVLACLAAATQKTQKEEKWAEFRRDAVKAIKSICCTVGVERNGSPDNCICKSNIGEVYNCLFNSMKDYTLDSRGDVGAWVREASMDALRCVTSMVVNKDPSLTSQDVCKTLFCCLVQQACEKIDRTRGDAGLIFFELLYHKPEIPHIPNREDLKRIFPREECERRMNWAAPASTFYRFTKLIEYPTYIYSVLLGLTVSVGGLTESLVKYSSSSLHTYLRNISSKEKELNDFTDTLLQIFKDHQKVDRVSIPMLKVLDQLLSKGCFDMYAQSTKFTYGSQILDLVKKEFIKSSNPQKLMFCADVYCGLLQFPSEVRRTTLTNILILMCHKYPRVRKTTADKLYEAVLTYDDIADEENMEEMTLLSETQWDNSVEEIRPVRNKLCDLFNIPKPVPVKQITASKGTKAT